MKRKMGRPPLDDAAKFVVTAKLSREDLHQLRARARASDRSVSGFIRHMIRTHLQQAEA